MKITSKIGALFLIIMMITSCDEADELTKLDFKSDFSTTVNVDITDDSDGEPQNWDETSSAINLASIEEIQADLIDDVRINALKFEIDNFVGEDNIVVSEASISFGATEISVSNINLQEYDANNTVSSIGTAAELNAIASALKITPEIIARVKGTISSTPVKFDVIITLDVTTTVDVL